jgi:hypothetical protein
MPIGWLGGAPKSQRKEEKQSGKLPESPAWQKLCDALFRSTLVESGEALDERLRLTGERVNQSQILELHPLFPHQHQCAEEHHE